MYSSRTSCSRGVIVEEASREKFRSGFRDVPVIVSSSYEAVLSSEESGSMGWVCTCATS